MRTLDSTILVLWERELEPRHLGTPASARRARASGPTAFRASTCGRFYPGFKVVLGAGKDMGFRISVGLGFRV